MICVLSNQKVPRRPVLKPRRTEMSLGRVTGAERKHCGEAPEPVYNYKRPLRGHARLGPTQDSTAAMVLSYISDAIIGGYPGCRGALIDSCTCRAAFRRWLLCVAVRCDAYIITRTARPAPGMQICGGLPLSFRFYSPRSTTLSNKAGSSSAIRPETAHRTHGSMRGHGRMCGATVREIAGDISS